MKDILKSTQILIERNDVTPLETLVELLQKVMAIHGPDAAVCVESSSLGASITITG